MTLRTRLALGLLTIVVVLVVPLLIAIQAMRRMHDDAQELRDREFAASLLLGTLRDGLNEVHDRETAMLFLRDSALRDTVEARVQLVSRLADSLEYYRLESPATNIRRSIEEIVAWVPKESDLTLAGHGHEADTISATHVGPALRRAETGVGLAERQLRRRTQDRVAKATSEISVARSYALLGLVAALLVALVIALWLVRSISRPVRELERGMGAVADGDFAYRLPLSSERHDEFGRLAASFDGMTRQLAELDKLKAEFVSVASHELKTPINVVLGYLQLLEEGVYGPVSPKQHEVHRTLEIQVQSLARLVKQLLDVSRFEAGGGRLEPRVMNLGRFLDELEQAFFVLATQRSVRFLVTREGDLPSEVSWDEDRMSEVLGNLLSNAFKFTPRGGEVELRVSPAEDCMQLQVRDTGAGIAPEQLPHIFRKFYQADNQRSASAKGTGLGLAITKSIVEAHRGSINVESTPGVGTTFTITMPMRVTGRRSSMQQRAVPASVGL